MSPDLVALQTRLLATHHSKPQTQELVRGALALVAEGLRRLEALGLQFHLDPGPGSVGDEWPRMMFHVDAAPNGRLVRSRWELADLGPGWFNTLEEAQHADGVATQFAGRGGIGRRDLPVPIQIQSETLMGPDPRREALKREFLARKQQDGS